MKIDLSVLGNTELISLMLMSRYRAAGYTRYRMDRFEEYDLYIDGEYESTLKVNFKHD